MLNKLRTRVISFLSVLLLVSVLMPSTASAEGKKFKDIPDGHTFYEEIDYLSSLGKLDGFLDGTFRSNDKVTRGQASKIISDLLELSYNPSKAVNFKDVPAEKWYHDGIQSLYQHEIMSGYKDGTIKPIKTLTRAEAAKLIGLAFELPYDNTMDISYSDVAKAGWSYSYIQRLAQSGVTVGDGKGHFKPDNEVTRGEFTAFVARAYKIILTTKPESTNKIVKITDELVTIDGNDFIIPAELKDLLNPANADILSHAKVNYKSEKNKITAINGLVLNVSGVKDKNLVLDGNGFKLEGDLIVKGDYLQVNNLSVSGDVFISSNVKHSFTTDYLTVLGKVYMKDSEEDSYNSEVATASMTSRITIVFANSKIAVVEISSKDIDLMAKGKTSITSLSLFTNANIFADEDIIFPKVEMRDGVTNVQLNVTIKEIIIESTDNILITGRGNVESIIVNTTNKVEIQTTGQIENITSSQIESSITLGANAQVKNIKLPEGQTASDFISNYDEVKGKVENVNGNKNPDLPRPPSIGGGGDYVPTPPSPPKKYFDAGVLQGKSFGYAKLNIKNKKTNSNVYYHLLPPYKFDDTLEKPLAIGDEITDSVNLYKDEEFIYWSNNLINVYQVDSSNKVTDVVEINQPWLWDFYDIHYNVDKENITIMTIFKKDEEATVAETFKLLHFYLGNSFYKYTVEDLENIQWDDQEDLPTITLPMKEGMQLNEYYYSNIQIVNGPGSYWLPGSGLEVYESTLVTLLKRYADEDISWLTFGRILSDFTSEYNVNPGEGIVKFNEDSITAYRQDVMTNKENLRTLKDFIDLVNDVNAKLENMDAETPPGDLEDDGQEETEVIPDGDPDGSEEDTSTGSESEEEPQDNPETDMGI